MQSWIILNPEWEYFLWDDNSIEKFVLRNKEKYYSSKNYGYKSDIARYEILNRLGGLYVDIDFECLKPIPNDFLSYDFISSINFDNSPLLGNALIFTKPNNIFLKNIIKEIKICKSNNTIDIFNSSGPQLITKIYFNLSKKTKENFLILPSNYYFPLPSFLLHTNNNSNKLILEYSLGIHHYGQSWMRNDHYLKRVLNVFYKIFKFKHILKKLNFYHFS